MIRIWNIHIKICECELMSGSGFDLD